MCLVCLGVAVGSASGFFGESGAVDAPELPQQPVVTQVVPWQSLKQEGSLGDSRCAKPGRSKVVEGVTFVCEQKGKKLKWVKQGP